MADTVLATFDGVVFRPAEPVDLEPNTMVRLIVEPMEQEQGAQKSFLETALGLKLEGPEDWSENVDKYLYGSDSDGAT